MAISARAGALGQRGEDHAVAHVEGLGWEVLDRNWRCRAGEIDIVAHDGASGTLVVVEVKCRSGRGFGDPLEAVTEEKVARLVRLAAAWLKEHQVRVPHVRVDAVGLVMGRDGHIDLTHVRGLGGW